MTLHRAHREFEDLDDLLICHSFHIEKADRERILGGKLPKMPLQTLFDVVSFEILLEVRGDARFGDCLEPIAERYGLFPLPGFLDEFVTGVDCNRGDPCRELRTALEPGQAFENVQENLLENLLVRCPVPNCPVDQVIDKVLVVLDQLVCIHRLFICHDGAIYNSLISRQNVATFYKQGLKSKRVQIGNMIESAACLSNSIFVTELAVIRKLMIFNILSKSHYVIPKNSAAFLRTISCCS